MERKTYAAIAIGGGVATIGAAWWLSRKSAAVVEAVKDAVVTGGKFKAHLTGYWPFVGGLTAKERLMEGGTNDRKGNPLHTLEMYLKDPIAHPFVSVAADYNVFPYGQRIGLNVWPNVVFRVVDTGGHFHGVNKVYRVMGEEPLDVCVESSKTIVPKKNVVATIFPGDNFEKGKAVATGGMKGQTVSLAGVAEGYTSSDHEALARALESELGGCSRDEMLVAGWAIRNRAANQGETIFGLLAPQGIWGSSGKSGGYASTRRVPTERAYAIAGEILDADSSQDLTDGAEEFWVPAQQDKLYQLGDVYRAAVSSGDDTRAKKYVRYAPYGSENDIRAKHAREGLRVLRAVGTVELLGKC